MALTKDELKDRQRHATQKVSTPEWGGDWHVYVRRLPATSAPCIREWGEIPEDIAEDEKVRRMSRLCALVLSDENGNSILDADSEEDVNVLANDATMLDMVVVNRVLDAAYDLNGLGMDLEKNSESIPPDDSPSD